MVPERFIFEYPDRSKQLLEMLEPEARKHNLIGSFSLLVASSIFLIPYERMKKGHPLKDTQREPQLYQAIRQVESERFLAAAFWPDKQLRDWRFSRIMNSANGTLSWQDKDGRHPMHAEAENTIGKRKAGEVLRVIRNALAHGNIVYLDDSGFETRGARVQYLAFLSRYEDDLPPQPGAETYRVVVATENDFLDFVKAWVAWLSRLPQDDRLFAAAAD